MAPNAKAQAAKEKGNTAFKAGDYPTAIGHYTTAFIADKSDFTFPLNRAAAYLKLNKNEDAERDCTTVLRMNPGNVKALFRRAQARIGNGKLGEAEQDLNDALHREPKNTTVQQELENIKKLRSSKKPAKASSSSPLPNTAPAVSPSQTQNPHPLRRRIPIEIVESSTSSTPPPVSASGSGDHLTPVSTRTITPPSSSPRDPPTTSSTQTTPRPSYKTAQEARAERKIGGGIFRHSGSTAGKPKSSTPDSPSDAGSSGPSKGVTRAPVVEVAPAPPTPIAPATQAIVTVNAPTTLFEFNSRWNDLQTPADRWTLLNTIPPPDLPSLFKTSLESSHLVSILNVLSDMPPETSGRVKEYLSNLTRVSRFGTIRMFLNKDEKEVVRKVWDGLGDQGRDPEARKPWGV